MSNPSEQITSIRLLKGRQKYDASEIYKYFDERAEFDVIFKKGDQETEGIFSIAENKINTDDIIFDASLDPSAITAIGVNFKCKMIIANWDYGSGYFGRNVRLRPLHHFSTYRGDTLKTQHISIRISDHRLFIHDVKDFFACFARFLLMQHSPFRLEFSFRSCNLEDVPEMTALILESIKKTKIEEKNFCKIELTHNPKANEYTAVFSK
jgi:hypothetical protein